MHWPEFTFLPKAHLAKITLAKIYISPKTYFLELKLARIYICLKLYFPENLFSRIYTGQNLHLAEKFISRNYTHQLEISLLIEFTLQKYIIIIVHFLKLISYGLRKEQKEQRRVFLTNNVRFKIFLVFDKIKCHFQDYSSKVCDDILMFSDYW